MFSLQVSELRHTNNTILSQSSIQEREIKQTFEMQISVSLPLKISKVGMIFFGQHVLSLCGPTLTDLTWQQWSCRGTGWSHEDWRTDIYIHPDWLNICQQSTAQPPSSVCLDILTPRGHYCSYTYCGCSYTHLIVWFCLENTFSTQVPIMELSCISNYSESFVMLLRQWYPELEASCFQVVRLSARLSVCTAT